jgi:hypothetical protein
MTPPANTAPPSHGRSRFCSGASAVVAFRQRLISHHVPSPNPEPAYSRPASSTGWTSRTSSFASGVLAPNSSAASSAGAMPACSLENILIRG